MKIYKHKKKNVSSKAQKERKKFLVSANKSLENLAKELQDSHPKTLDKDTPTKRL